MIEYLLELLKATLALLPSLEVMAQTVTYAAIVCCILYVPYTIAALLLYEQHPRLKKVKSSPNVRFHILLKVLKRLTVIHLIGMLVLVNNVSIRIAAASGDVPPLPAWSYILTMMNTIVLLGILFSPGVYLLRVKWDIMHWKYKGF